ncbi:MAG TPA: efflux RND transporter periplasmic adaptor subunit [Tepidisphaeraceae bacterium]|nr:efflux RND transporter periplasmic adaptor subunit [Tepidisphaeraceae bacterium]
MPDGDKQHASGELQRQVLSTAAVLGIGVLVVLLLKPAGSEPQTAREADTEQTAPVRVVRHGEIAIAPETPLMKRLSFTTVSAQKLSTPILTATGAVIARLAVGAGTTRAPSSAASRPAGESPTRPTAEPATVLPAWNFGSPDLFTTYTSWIQSQDDVEYNQDEVAKIRGLDEAKVADLQKTATRLRELVRVGSDAPKDLQAAEADLLQAQLQMEKDTYEAKKTLTDSLRVRDSLARQLIDADAPPDLLVKGQEGTLIVAADVPESRVPLIAIGAACTARFYGLPGITFSGKVARIGSVLVKDRRTLRVLFVIEDPQNRLHSNMFAEVGLGTDARDALVVPVNALVHDGGADYVLVAAGPGAYRAVEVLAGDPVGGTDVEILKGIKAGDQIVSGGTILLKPYVVSALEEVK